MPMIVLHDGGKLHSLVADTSIRPWHSGRHPYGSEDAGKGRARDRRYPFRLSDR